MYKLINADFREVNLPDDSIDAIITDPPYLKEYLSLLKDFAIFARRVLKPGGNLLVLIGHYHLPEIMKMLCQYLDYQWILCLKLTGQHCRLWEKKIFVSWKPILWFTKGTKKQDHWVPDMVVSNKQEKQYHIWQQNLSEFYDLVKKFTNPGDTVLDPFLGSGTTAVAAIIQNRNFIGIDVDPECIEITEKRIQETVEKMKWFYPDLVDAFI